MVREEDWSQDTAVGVYTPELASKVRNLGKPFLFTVDIVEHSHSYSLRVYEPEVRKFSPSMYIDAADYLNNLKHLLEAHGLIVFIEGVKGDAPRRR